MIRKMIRGMRAVFRIAAYALFAAACVIAVPDCAKSVAFAKLYFTSCMNPLVWLGAKPFFTAHAGEGMRRAEAVLNLLPAWPVLLLAALLFYWLAAIRVSFRLRR